MGACSHENTRMPSTASGPEQVPGPARAFTRSDGPLAQEPDPPTERGSTVAGHGPGLGEAQAQRPFAPPDRSRPTPISGTLGPVVPAVGPGAILIANDSTGTLRFPAGPDAAALARSA